LFASGGVYDDVSLHFVDGREADLRDAIRDASAAHDAAGESPLLTPGEVYALALGLTGGDAKQAMLLGHNTLRSLARDGDVGYTGLQPDPRFFERHLVQVRDADDNAGPWYHLFGTAYFSMVEAGDKGEYISGAGLAATVLGYGFLAAIGGWPGVAIRVLVLLANAGGATHAVLSRAPVTNFLEQAYREWVKGRTPDPEKFCFNVWGYEVGESLWENLPTRGDRGETRPYSGFPVPENERAPWAPRPGRFVNYTNSPLSVQWVTDEGTVVLDQGDATDEVAVLGEAPMLVLPVPEDDGTWGAVWMGQAGESAEVTFERTASGDAAVVRIDGETGEGAIWDLPAGSAGDRYSATFDDDTVAPELVGADGVVVEPTLFDLEEAGVGASTAVSDSSDDGATALGLLLIGLAVLVVLVGLVVLLASRRRPAVAGAVATGAPMAGAAPPSPGPAVGSTVYVTTPCLLYDSQRAPVAELQPGVWYRVVAASGSWVEVEGPGVRGWVGYAELHQGTA